MSSLNNAIMSRKLSAHFNGKLVVLDKHSICSEFFCMVNPLCLESSFYTHGIIIVYKGHVVHDGVGTFSNL